MLHPTIILDSSASIGKDVSIGPYSIIEKNVIIGEGCQIGSHVTIGKNTVLGNNNKVFSYASVGLESQDKKDNGEESRVVIGDNNTIREFATINRGTQANKGETKIGSSNLLLAYTHIAHDCILMDNIVMSNNATIAGHVVVESNTTLSLLAVVHQYCRIGSYAFIGMSTVIKDDVPPYMIVSDSPARVRGINTVGMIRNKFSKDDLKIARTIYKTIHKEKLRSIELTTRLDELYFKTSNPLINTVRNFLNNHNRSIIN